MSTKIHTWTLRNPDGSSITIEKSVDLSRADTFFLTTREASGHVCTVALKSDVAMALLFAFTEHGAEYSAHTYR